MNISENCQYQLYLAQKEFKARDGYFCVRDNEHEDTWYVRLKDHTGNMNNWGRYTYLPEDANLLEIIVTAEGINPTQDIFWSTKYYMPTEGITFEDIEDNTDNYSVYKEVVKILEKYTKTDISNLEFYSPERSQR